jgi:hypothetical protein
MLAERGHKRAALGGQDGLRVIMMCEVPSNAILAEQFLEYFDGMSIGSNDLTQLTLGLDRDSGMEVLARDFDERDPAVKALISRAIAGQSIMGVSPIRWAACRRRNGKAALKFTQQQRKTLPAECRKGQRPRARRWKSPQDRKRDAACQG